MKKSSKIINIKNKNNQIKYSNRYNIKTLDEGFWGTAIQTSTPKGKNGFEDYLRHMHDRYGNKNKL